MQEHSHVEYPTLLQQSHVGIALLLQITWKATIGPVTSVNMSKCEFHLTDLYEILYLGFLLKLDKITDTLHEGLHQFMWLIYITEVVCVLCEVQMRLRKHLVFYETSAWNRISNTCGISKGNMVSCSLWEKWKKDISIYSVKYKKKQKDRAKQAGETIYK